ncbi:MAG: Guanine nucleotide exchange factor lte1, partial [Phylliscum demangeonii]
MQRPLALIPAPDPDRVLAVVPAAAAAPRQGRQFTVANVGNHGKIYLRPVVRPVLAIASARAPPVSSPIIGGPKTQPSLNRKSRSSALTLDSVVSGLRTPRTQPRPSPPSMDAGRPRSPSPPPPPMPTPRRVHRDRAHSFSTVDDRGAAADGRPRTADPASVPVLRVQIPHYRLGSPRFSSRGTAFLHSSIYTQTSSADDVHWSTISQAELEKMFPLPSAAAASPRHARARPGPAAAPDPPWSPTSVDPRRYDDLTFAPAADDPAVVRYSAVSGQIVAATAPRLIAQITSPTFLDYDLLSDFFLTFRAFLAPPELVAYLTARLEWAARRTDETGKIVSVRTFVAIRHWILNYFVDDFVPDYALRARFCDMLNRLYARLTPAADGVMREHKVIGELKKCWRRTCALYWDPAPAVDHDPDGEIRPGGRPGSRHEPAAALAGLGFPARDAVPAPMDAIG